MNTPTPLDLVVVAPKPDPVRVRRACTSKVRYLTEACAHEAAMRRMLINASIPLRSYPCDYCAGFHLTSKDSGRNNPVDAPALLAPADLRDIVGYSDFQGPGQRQFKRYLSKRHRRGLAQSRREAEADDRIDRLPKPSPATPAEVAAFFGETAPVTTLPVERHRSNRLAA